MTDARRHALGQHAEACEDCRASQTPVEEVAALLDAVGVTVDPEELSRLALARATPMLHARARAVFWRRLRTALVAALLPLPLVVAADVLVLGWVYELIAACVPAGVALYVVLGYGAWLLVAIGSVYAAIPLLLARLLPQPDTAPA